MFPRLSASTGMPVLDAGEDFARARRAQRWGRVASWLRAEPGRLASLPDAGVRRAGAPSLRCLPMERIVGTVEPSPHFDAAFRPASRHLRSRWERVALAARRDVSLPPITVREGPDGFYVLDGRHRVSVARARGRPDIDAWIV